MTSLYEMFETSADAEVSGCWVDVGPSSFKLARSGGANENFMKTAAKRLKPFQAALDSMGSKAQSELAVGIFVDTVLMDWKNVTDRSGTVLDYSKDNAKTLLLALPNLYTALQAESTKLSNFVVANLEAAAKN